MVSWLVSDDVPIPEPELNAARRRAMFVLAAELETPERHAALGAALDALPTADLPSVAAAVEALRADPELAWRSFALALLADEIADE
jgi:hypothetical protein